MKSKAEIKQRLMRIAVKQWGLASSDQLDPAIKLFIEVFGELAYENEGSIEDIKERLLEQIAALLTPDNMIVAKPAHSVLTVMPVESEANICRNTEFYTNTPTNAVKNFGLRTLNFAPVCDNIKLVKAEIKYLLCEQNLYKIEHLGEKELITKASTFYQDFNQTIYIGFDLDKEIKSLQNIHFYIDFPNTTERYNLFDLLSNTIWHIDGNPITMKTGIYQEPATESILGGIFSLYNTLQTNDEDVMELYRKQFLHISDNVKTKNLTKTAFPSEMTPFFPGRVNSLDPVYWIKVTFPPYFKKNDLEDISVYLNALPVSNKSLNTQIFYADRSITGILPLPVDSGSYFLAVDSVSDFAGYEYKFLPYSTSEIPMGGTYTIKRSGIERFSTRDLRNMIEKFIDLLRTDLAVFNALKINYMNDTIKEIEQAIVSIRETIGFNNPQTLEVPTYLLIESQIDKVVNMEAKYWTTSCDLANDLSSGTQFKPLKNISLSSDSCYLLKTTNGGKTMPRKEEMLTAYKYILAARDQLFSIRDIENFCHWKFSNKMKSLKIQRGIACSHKQKEGLIRTLDVIIEPLSEHREIFNPIAIGEFEIELKKRSPQSYIYRIIIN